MCPHPLCQVKATGKHMIPRDEFCATKVKRPRANPGSLCLSGKGAGGESARRQLSRPCTLVHDDERSSFLTSPQPPPGWSHQSAPAQPPHRVCRENWTALNHRGLPYQLLSLLLLNPRENELVWSYLSQSSGLDSFNTCLPIGLAQNKHPKDQKRS